MRLARYAARRTAGAAALVVATITVTFFIYWITPTEPAQFVYPYAQRLTDEQVQRGNELLGTDRSVVVQYGDYLWHLVRGDFGHAWTGSRVTGEQELDAPPVGPQVMAAAGITGSLIVGGALVIAVLSIPLGALATRSRVADRLILLFTLIGICLHPMVVGLILRTVFADRLGWAPPRGYCPLFGSAASPDRLVFDPATAAAIECGGPADWASHLILPWASFAFVFLALYTRITRAAFLEELGQDYVRAARAKGVREARILGRHVLPNAVLPGLMLLAAEMGTALGVAVYVESAFGLSGLGRLAVLVLTGSLGLDLPVILATVVLLTLLVVVGTLVVDLAAAVIDPRISTAALTHRRRRATGLV